MDAFQVGLTLQWILQVSKQPLLTSLLGRSTASNLDNLRLFDERCGALQSA